MSRHQRIRFTRIAAGSAVLALGLLAGCTGGPGTDDPTPTTATTTPTPTPSPTPTPTTDPTLAAAEAAVLEAYRGFWDAQVAYLAAPNDREPDALRQYAVDKALSGVREVARMYQDNGVVSRGQPEVSAEVTQLSLDGGPTALITACVDVTNWQPFFESTGESAAAPGQLNRQLSEAQAIYYADRWVIREITIYRDRSC